MKGWIGVDFDGTLVQDEMGEHPGAPIPAMINTVKRLLDQGQRVRIFTARIAPPIGHTEKLEVLFYLDEWCVEHLGRALPVTCVKDYQMILLYDDRVVEVERNRGTLRASGLENDLRILANFMIGPKGYQAEVLYYPQEVQEILRRRDDG